MIVKETLQAFREPSILFVAFILPPILLFLFGYAVSLDVKEVPIAVVVESHGEVSGDLARAFQATSYFETTLVQHRREAEDGLVAGQIKGMVVIPAVFERQVRQGHPNPELQIITDGSEPNSANFVRNYVSGTYALWLRSNQWMASAPQGVSLEHRFWFNPELDSRRILVPGAIAMVMAMIGTMLTAMVLAREWERGTMEAIMSTPITMLEIIVSKLLPYFCLGVFATVGCTFAAVYVMGVSMQGSILAMLGISVAFLFPALGQGLLISSALKNQFGASEVALMSAFLPALMLSGFIFEIQSMPAAIQAITYVLPVRYYVASLQTVFVAGDIWPELLRNIASMLVVGVVFFTLTLSRSRKRLD